MALERKAFRVTACGVDSIVSETTRGRAAYAVLRSARDAGYKVKYTDILVPRDKRYDSWAAKTRMRVVAEDYIVNDQTVKHD